LARALLAKCSADPFPNGQTLTPGQAPDVRHFLIRKEDLKTFTHSVSITCSF
jgi:hypothetical protein